MVFVQRFWRWLKKHWKRNLLLLVILLLIGGGAWRWWSSKQAATAVETTQPEYRNLVKTLEFTGIMDAHERVKMRFAAGGKLIYLSAKEGDSVKRGQTIASLDARSVQKNLQNQLSLYEEQRLDFETAQDDRKDRTLDTDENRSARKDQLTLERTINNVELQSFAIEDTRLSSPFAGVLVSSPAMVTGVQLAPSDVFEVVNPSTLYFRVLVDEVDIDQVSLNQMAEVRLDAYPDITFRTQVSKIALTSAQASSGTVFPVELKFLDEVNIQQQRLGMNGEANFILDSKENVLSVPIEVLSSRDGGSFVKVKVGETIEDRPVKLGLETEQYAEIVEGLSPSDQVVLP